MSYNFNLPSITGKNADEKIQQLLSYIYKLVGDLNYFANQSADSPRGESTQVGNDANSTSLAVIQKRVRDLQAALNEVKEEIESIPVVPPEVEYLVGVTENIQTQIDAVNEAIAGIEIPTLPDLAKVATSGSYNDLVDKPSIPNVDGLADDIEVLFGTVVYKVDPTVTTPLYCNGSITASAVNSVTITDPNKEYKRLKIFARFPYASHIQEFDLETPAQGSVANFGNRVGGILIPAGDNVSGASKHYLYKLNFCVGETTNGWTFQITDSGWVNMGIPNANASQYASTSVALNGTSYQAYNQRHNSDYGVFKIIAYK